MTKWLPIVSLIIVAVLAGLWHAGLIPAEVAFGVAVLLPGGDTLLRSMGLTRPPLDAAYIKVTAAQLGQVTVDFDRAGHDAYMAYGNAVGWQAVGGAAMPAWADLAPRIKGAWAEAARGAHGTDPGVPAGSLAPNPTPPPPAAPALRVAVLLLLPLLSLGCATTWGQALERCALKAAPTAATQGVALAIHKGEGWEQALADLIGTYGTCTVNALVQSYAEGQGAPPPARAAAITTESLVGGELTARAPQLDKAELARRARVWLGR